MRCPRRRSRSRAARAAPDEPNRVAAFEPRWLLRESGPNCAAEREAYQTKAKAVLSRNLDQRQGEMQGLAGEGMICVECDSRIGEIGDDQRDIALRRPHLYRHPYFRLDPGKIELVAVNGLRQFFDSVTVGLLGRDDNVFRLADLHTQQSLIEAWNYLSGADGESQRI